MRQIRLAPLVLTVVLGSAWLAGAAEVERIERGNLVIEGIPEIPEAVTLRLDQYRNTRSASLGGWLPDGGGIIISTRFGDTSQLHLVTEPGGARRQLTFFEEPVGGASVNPAQRRLLFARDVGGSEFYQLFDFDLDSGRYRMLTDGSSRNMGGSWSSAGDRFAYATTRRNGRDMDIHVMAIAEPGVSRPLLEAGGAWFAGEWSPDDTKLVALRYVSANESYPYLVDVASGATTPMFEAEERVAYGPAVWAHDGTGLYFTSNRGREFQTLRFYDIASGSSRVVRDDIAWDVGSLEMSPDGRLLAFVVNADGIDRLHVMDLEAMAELPLPALPQGVIYGVAFSPDGSRLGLVLNTPTSPGDVYTIELAKQKIVRWTFSEVGGLNPETFVDAELVRYPTFDTVDGAPRTIPAFLYRPQGAGPFPVLIDIHGGPEGQERPVFSSWTQYLVNELGIAVVAPNVRGSSGYGKSYLDLDNAFKREDSVKDIGALLDWIATRPELDASRVGVYGGSYGGYMVLASMVHYNERLRAGIDVVGISSFVTFLENTQEYRRDLRRVEYGDERDPEMRAHLEAISPLAKVAEITKPLFVVQGLNDPRVPVGESEQIVKAVRANGGDVWYLLARDEGHGFQKKANRDYQMEAQALFLKTHLVGGE